ncbi:TetR/AcrR family transcriptional regulator [Pseudonocardia bannensis]|uniref:TetR/AcrR family transcriptional regulator n=1 Tax=Pseudonocardia bannensis TaxID=630973 RepID=A0A848DLK5_9PSEU|nr:TetR/AcrR family transcriptional regulator [Pseudonocardia bannensis]NMH93592.1 TetR/AcrR family transcriptional regulator [Pseudonocardia bannensis]
MLHSGHRGRHQVRTERRGRTIRSEAQDRRASGRRRSPQSHAAILDATLQLLEEVGYPRLTIEGVAARAGVGKTTVYRWWPSKKALAIEAINSRVDDVPITVTGDLQLDLRAALQAILDSYAASPVGETIPAVAVDLLRDPEAPEQMQALLRSHRDPVRVILENAAGRGDLPADVDAQLLQDIFSATLLYRFLVRRSSADHAIDQLLALVLEGRVPRTAPQAQPQA